MPRINLLPWREELRKEREKNFGIAIFAAVGLAAGIVYYGKFLTDQMIDHQKSRNAFLEEQIAELDEQIAEIQRLEQTKQELIARMQIIEQLQASRPKIVHLFEEMVLTLPNGVYLKSLTQKGDSLEIEGTAQSSARVSAFMRNINQSEWLGDPELTVIQTREEGRARLSDFTLRAKAIAPKPEGEEEEEVGP